MDISTTDLTDNLFAALGDQSAQLTTLANQALGNGIDRYQNEDYEGAAKEFRRAVGLDPYSDYAVDATRYMAMSYEQLGNSEKAIEAYEQILELQPDRDDMHLALGNLLFKEGRTGEAIESYEKAVRIYDDATNRFSLGQGYLKAGRYEEAAVQFEKVIQMDESSANGYFGLGQAYSAQKDTTSAIEQFERAISKKDDFWAAYAEMGYTYADAGQTDKAEEIRDFLENEDEDMADTLDSYINKMTQPQILTAWPNASFQYYMPPKTNVSELGDYLKTANSSQSFSMIFQFSKEMDRESVENLLNWQISRSYGNGPGTNYNNGLPLPDTEARISPMPTDVYYDAEYFTATVRFTLNQNATADATIDPSHLVFSFNGEDADGNEMNSDYDQYMGFSGSF